MMVRLVCSVFLFFLLAFSILGLTGVMCAIICPRFSPGAIEVWTYCLDRVRSSCHLVRFEARGPERIGTPSCPRPQSSSTAMFAFGACEKVKESKSFVPWPEPCVARSADFQSTHGPHVLFSQRAPCSFRSFQGIYEWEAALNVSTGKVYYVNNVNYTTVRKTLKNFL